jgi:hypothetical protein
MASYEDAQQCPMCKVPGEVTNKTSARQFTLEVPKGSQYHTIFCRNDRCKWYDSSWVVLVYPDGTIPDPRPRSSEPRRPKQFEVSKAMQAQMDARFQEMLAQQRRPGTETR